MELKFDPATYLISIQSYFSRSENHLSIFIAFVPLMAAIALSKCVGINYWT